MGFIFLLWIVAVITTVIKISSRKDIGDSIRIIWIIVVIILPAIGMCIYYFAETGRRLAK